MAVTHGNELTISERRAIEERHAPYHRFAEFWDGYDAYWNDTGRYRCPHGWSHSVPSQAWHHGADAAMRVRSERKMEARDDCERDDRETELQIATLDRLIEEREAAEHVRGS